MSSRACRIVLALSFLASAARTARAAPMVAVPLPPPPQGMALSSPAPRPFLVGAKVGLDSPLGNGGDGAPVLEADVATPVADHRVRRGARVGPGAAYVPPLQPPTGAG